MEGPLKDGEINYIVMASWWGGRDRGGRISREGEGRMSKGRNVGRDSQCYGLSEGSMETYYSKNSLK